MDDETIAILSHQEDDVEDEDKPITKQKKQKTRSGCCPLLRLASCVAALGGVLFGYDIGIVSGAMLQLKEDFKLECFKQEMIVTSLLVGGLGAAFVGGYIIDYFGRKIAIIINSFIFIGGAVILAMSKSFSVLIVGRLLVGFAVALSATAECIYIAEISPPMKRGFLVSLNELGITLGILLAYLVNYLLINVPHGWRLMFGLSSLPAFLQAIGMMLLPSSPRWLMARSKEEQAKSVMAALWPGVNTEKEIAKIKNALSNEKDYSFYDLISSRENMRFRMFIGCGLVFFQQLTGQPTILYYAPAVFQSLGFKSGASATLATVGLGVIKVVFTMLALLNVDRLGRRCFLLVGAIVMTTSVIVLTAVTEPIHHLRTTTTTTNLCGKSFHIGGNNTISNTSFIESSIVNGHPNVNYSKINMTQKSLLTRRHTESIFPNSTDGKKKTESKSRLKGISKGVKYGCLIALMSFVAGYAVGYGPVSWLILTEIFPVGIKGRAVSVATIFNWGTNIIISSTFLDVIGNIGPSWTFLTYSVIGILATIFIYHFIPETKRRTLEQVTHELNKRSVVCIELVCCRKTASLHVHGNEEISEETQCLQDDVV